MVPDAVAARSSQPVAEHLGHPLGGVPAGAKVRNGATAKTLHTDLGPVEIRTPRDRDASFQPQLVRKRQTRLAGLDAKILALYAGGMTVRDIAGHLTELYGIEVSPDTISRVTDAVLEDGARGRWTPCTRSSTSTPSGCGCATTARSRTAPAISPWGSRDGEREVLGIWWQETEGARFWLAALNDLQRRGVSDVLIACVDGLTGFPEAIGAVFPQAWVQTCIVHQIRSSLRYVNHRDRRTVANDLRPIYTATNAETAEQALAAFHQQWGGQYPMIAAGDQHDRGAAPPDPQGDQDPRAVPRRTVRHQADLPGDRTIRRQVAQQPGLDRRPRRPQDPPRRPIPRLTPPPLPTTVTQPHTQNI